MFNSIQVVVVTSRNHCDAFPNFNESACLGIWSTTLVPAWGSRIFRAPGDNRLAADQGDPAHCPEARSGLHGAGAPCRVGRAPGGHGRRRDLELAGRSTDFRSYGNFRMGRRRIRDGIREHTHGKLVFVICEPVQRACNPCYGSMECSVRLPEIRSASPPGVQITRACTGSSDVTL